MLNLLPLVVVFPLAGFVVLTITRDRIAERVAAMVGVGSIGLAALVALRLVMNSLRPRRQVALTRSRCGRGCESVILHRGSR
jgi:hypothetical protein